MTASCCWCHVPLVHVDGQWWCQTKACRAKQLEHAVYGGKGKGWLYVPTPKQTEFDACPAKYVLYGGAAGPGKSHAARWALYRKALRIPNFEALMLRKTYPELEKTHLRRMEREVSLFTVKDGKKEIPRAIFHKTAKIMEFPETKAIIECGHMDDAGAVEKYLSTEYDVIVADEGSTFDPQPLLELSTRARSSKPEVKAEGGAKFWVVSNPGGPASSTLLDFFIDHEPDFDQYPALRKTYDANQWIYIPGTLDDNPYLDPEYANQLAVLSKWRYEQLRYGDWRVFAGQFFSEWQTTQHVATLEPGAGCQWFRSMDWGRNQPGCVLWWAVLPDHQLYIRKEYKFQGMSEQDVAVQVKAIDQDLGVKVTYTAADPAIFSKTGATHTNLRYQFTGQSIGESLNHYGLKLVKGDNDRFNGWGRCQALLRPSPDGTPWLRVHPDCRYLLRSISAAVSDKKDPDDVDTNTDDHALDAWRYGAMSRPSPLSKTARPRFAPGTMGALRQSVGTWAKTVIGSESVRAS